VGTRVGQLSAAVAVPIRELDLLLECRLLDIVEILKGWGSDKAGRALTFDQVIEARHRGFEQMLVSVKAPCGSAWRGPYSRLTSSQLVTLPLSVLFSHTAL
jgi:hypothetical protein